MKAIILMLFGLVLVQANNRLLEDFIQGNIQFTANIYKELAKSNSGNLLLCPLSGSLILSLVHSGARGNTAAQLASALQVPNDSRKIQEIYSILARNLDSDKYFLISANKVYIKHGLPIIPQFRSTAVNVFQSDVQNIDFERKQQAASEMNRWVAEKTHQKIKNLINPDDLNERTRAVLINAMYFQGNWLNSFYEALTGKQPFYVNNQRRVDVDTMQKQSYFRFYESSKLKAKFLELPYVGEDAIMTIVLPDDKQGLAALETHLVDVFTTPQCQTRFVNVALPKFKIESRIDFKDILMKLGAVDAFQNYADFSGIANDDPPLKINNVVQKTFIEIDEVGTTAASATAVQMGIPTSLPPPPEQFIADHPFIYYIKIRNVLVFAGRYISP